MQIKPLKERKCKVCKERFQPLRPLQSVCGMECAKDQASQVRVKAEKKDYRVSKERLKSRGDWAREAQASFNAFIRARDKAEGYGCISCGTKQGKENGGHFLSVGSTPELRFEEKNCHLQCERCNTYLHGNILAYRNGLVQRYGLEYVEWLESKHDAKHYSIDDLKNIKKVYKQKIKEL